MSKKQIKSSKFEEFLVSEYLKHGSINKVFQEHNYNLPISFAGYDRLLTKFGVVKSAGPNSKISESLHILSLLANYKISLEKVYRKYAPKTIQVSTNTLHRILHYTRLGLTRRTGVALLISSNNEPNRILLGRDQSLDNRSLGNKGDLSLPMGHSKTGESIKDSITRVLQNEVLTQNVITQSFPWQIIPDHIKPEMYINIADIQVSVYKLVIPKELISFSSYKLTNLQFYDVNNLPNQKYRPGVIEILNFLTNKNKNTADTPVIFSDLNLKIYSLAKQPAE